MSRVAALWDAWAEEDSLGESLSPFASGGTPPSVTFPTTRLVSRVQVALGADLSADPLTWGWADISDRVRFDLGISQTVGKRDEATRVSAGTGTLKLDNRDGYFSRRNPLSPYYGLLSKNTPIWVTVDAGDGEHTRMELFVNEWPTRWTDKSATDSTVTIRCAGVQRRLAQGEVLKSPLRRAVLATSPEAYWPLEDGNAADGAGAAVEGPPLRIQGTIDFAAFTDLVGAVQTPGMSAGALFGSVSGVSATAWHVEFAIKMAFNGTAIARIYAPASAQAGFWRIFLPIDAAGEVRVFVTDVEGGSVLFALNGTTVTAAFENAWHHIAVTAEQSGGNIVGRLYVDGVLQATGSGAGTLAAPQEFWANHNFAVVNVTSMAHIAVGSGLPFSDAANALDGYAGEQAHERMTRLAGEEGVLFATTAVTSAAMGPQGIAKFLDLVHECEAADGGVLYEKRWGLAYKSLAEYYNQPAGLALDFDQGHIGDLPEPADDDQRLRNKWTVARTNGSEYTAEETSGPMGTGTEGPGVYDDSVTLNLETDDQLVDQAHWRLHLGLVDGDRWPAIGLNFARSPELIDDFTALGYGARVTVDNPPVQMPPDQLDLIVEGYTERWDQFVWTTSLNTSPASPFQLGSYQDASVVAADRPTRYDGQYSTTNGSFVSGAGSLSVATSQGPLWSTTCPFPLYIKVYGITLTVSAISGSSSPQTLTVTASNLDGVTIPSGSEVHVADRGYYALGG